MKATFSQNPVTAFVLTLIENLLAFAPDGALSVSISIYIATLYFL